MQTLRDQQHDLVLVGQQALYLVEAAADRVGRADQQLRQALAERRRPAVPEPHHVLGPLLGLGVSRSADEDAAPRRLLTVLDGTAVLLGLHRVALAKLVVE